MIGSIFHLVVAAFFGLYALAFLLSPFIRDPADGPSRDPRTPEEIAKAEEEARWDALIWD